MRGRRAYNPAMHGPGLACLAALSLLFCGLPFALYRARHRVGLSPLCIFVGGAIVHMHLVTIAVPMLDTRIAFASVTLVPSLLSLALLLYIRSGLTETRRYILTLVGVSLGWSLVNALVWGALRDGGVSFFVDVPPGAFIEFVRVAPRSMLASASALLVDLFLILITWQWLQNRTRLPLAARAFLALFTALCADSAIFVLGAFWPADFVWPLLKAHLAGKALAAAFNASLIAAYVKFVEPEGQAPEVRGALDILHVKQRLEKVERALETSEQRYRQLFENILDAVVVIRTGRIIDLNRRAEQMFGMTKEDLKNSSAGDLGLPAVTESFEVARLILKDGRELTVEAAGVNLDVGGEDARLVTIRDVSDRERAAILIRRKNSELEAMNSVAVLGIRNVPLQEVLDEAVRKVQELTGTDSAAMCLAGEDRKYLLLAAATGITDEIRNKSGEIRFGLLWKVYQGGEALVENDLASRTDARKDLMPGNVTVFSTVAAPIVSRGRVIGTLSACSYRPRSLGMEEAGLLATMGAQLGTVIENARLLEWQREQKEVSEILLAAATAFGRARSVNELAETLLEAATWSSGMPGATFLEYDQDRDLLRISAISGGPEAARKILLTRTWGPGNPIAHKLRDGRVTLVLTAEEMKRLDPEAWGAMAPAATVFAPMFQQERLLGALTVNFSDVAKADSPTVSTLEGLAGLCAASLANLNLWQIAERRAELGDSLLRTGQELASARDPERVVRGAAARARALAGSAAAWVWVISPGGFRVDAQDGELADIAGKQFEAESLFDGRLSADGVPAAVPDFEAPGTSAGMRATGAILGARSALAVPIRAGGRILGAVCVADAAPRLYSHEDVTALETLATYTAVCLENARLLQDVSLSNEEIRDAQAQLVRAESLAAIGRLSAAIAHEVRNPLSGISAAAQALLKSAGQTGAAPSDIQLLKIIDRESKRLNRIITDFLQFARPRSPALRRVAIPALIESTLSLLEQEMSGRFRVEREFPPEVPFAQADGDQIKQVLINLLLNSVQAMPAGGTITTRACPAELSSGPAVEISIEDSGPGIPPGDLPRVFEPFFSTKKEGTGLGLAIAHQIVQAHGGAITAHSAASGGALFRILLPVAPVATPLPSGRA